MSCWDCFPGVSETVVLFVVLKIKALNLALSGVQQMSEVYSGLYLRFCLVRAPGGRAATTALPHWCSPPRLCLWSWRGEQGSPFRIIRAEPNERQGQLGGKIEIKTPDFSFQPWSTQKGLDTHPSVCAALGARGRFLPGKGWLASPELLSPASSHRSPAVGQTPTPLFHIRGKTDSERTQFWKTHDNNGWCCSELPGSHVALLSVLRPPETQE